MTSGLSLTGSQLGVIEYSNHLALFGLTPSDSEPRMVA